MNAADDDDVDIAAAVTEIEQAYLNKQNAEPQAHPPRQKTLDSFFGASSSTHEPPQQQKQSDDVQVPIDSNAAATWVYPANVPRRDYQFSITKTALFANTLVSLPTGLGKTLIAAVVIYNFYRWFPNGKIVFTAPSKPLVLQQIEACHNVVGIPQELTIDMTGQINPAHRAELWKNKRVFFVTPQVLEKDINSGTCPLREIVCLVVDEAHRALGNYSYCVVVREIITAKVNLRILALTATPGSKHTTIQTVIDNLKISCMEYRDEDDPDVSQYTHNRKLELVSVAMDSESAKIRDMLLDILQPVVMKLCSYGVFYNRDLSRLTPFEFLTARDKFRQAPPAALAPGQCGEVEGCFGVAITLCHIFKLLSTHGIRPAYEMLQQKLQQGILTRLMSRNEKVHQVKQLMHQSVNHGASNPKLVKMEEIVLHHFATHDPSNTRIIIFTNFRESVKDIMEALFKLDGAVKAMEFIGQSSGKHSKGQTQKMQQQVLQKFRAGGYNTIVATCIGEEGLDIMEVDLVICFDANISPLRMIQRMGRTGRKRDGRVVVLASEGNELQGYLNKQAKSKAIGKHMQNGGINSFNFHTSSRMIPHAFRPEVKLMELTIEQFVPRGRKAKQDTPAAVENSSTELTEEENMLLAQYLKSSTWTPSLIAFPTNQLVATRIKNVKHSSRTVSMLIGVLQELRGVPSSKENEEHRPIEIDVNQPTEEVQHVEEQYNESEWQDDVLTDILTSDETENRDEFPLANDKDPDNQSEEEVQVNFNLHVPESSQVIGHENIATEEKQILEPQAPIYHFFSTGVVSISDSGHVMLSSPPRLTGMANSQEEFKHSFSPRVTKSDEFVLETPEIKRTKYSSPECGKASATSNLERSYIHTDKVEERGSASKAFSAAKSPLTGLNSSTELSALKAETPGSLDDKSSSEKNLVAKTPSTCGSEDWKCHSSQLPSALRNPRPLKRLKRGRELLKTPTNKQRRKLMVEQYIDEEAEVSSDEEVSEDEEEDSRHSNRSFINDNVQSSGAASVDMMAVYRRSLLTQQSPAGGFNVPSTTPGSRSYSTSSMAQDRSYSTSSMAPDASAIVPDSVQKSSVPPSSRSNLPPLELRRRKLSFDPSLEEKSHAERGDDLFSDDIFDGVDLDALEADAAEQCRSRQQSSQPSFELGL